ncbi:hypothetical protein [Nocardioides bruguierae]|nr:hypothetical protein [Nocardioides bruguierae]
MTDTLLTDGIHLVWENVVESDGSSHLESHWERDGVVVTQAA